MEYQDNQSPSFSVTEVLPNNVTQPIPIVLITIDTFTINSFVKVTTNISTFGNLKKETLIWKSL